MVKTLKGAAALVAVLGAAVLWTTIRTSGQSGSMPSTKNGDWTHYTADMRGHEVRAARSDQRVELQQARGCLALQDRQPRHAP